MGFPMTVERVISRNGLDRANPALMDDLRRLAEDSATLDRRALAEKVRALPEQHCPLCPDVTAVRSGSVNLDFVLAVIEGRP